MFTRCVGTSLLRSASSAAVSRRSACRGDTRRSASSGRSANTSATHTPIASPIAMACQSSDTLTSTGRKSLMATGNRELDRDAERGAGRRARQSHDGRLRHIDRQHLPARRAEAAKHRDRVDLPRDEGVHAARDADAAEQQRDEADDPEKVGELLDGLGDARLTLHDGHHAHVLALESRAQRPHPFRAADRRRELHEPLVRRATAEPEELRLRRVALGKEHARGHHERRVGLPGHALDRADDLELHVSDRQRVTDACVERDQQGGVDDRIRSLLQSRPLAGAASSRSSRRRDIPASRP